MRSRFAVALIAIAGVMAAGADARPVIARATYRPYLVGYSDLPHVIAHSLSITPVSRSRLRQNFQGFNGVAQTAIAGGYRSGVEATVRFFGPDGSYKGSGIAATLVGAFGNHAAASGVATRWVAEFTNISYLHHPTIRVPQFPSGTIITAYGHGLGSAAHPGMAFGVWVEGSCLLWDAITLYDPSVSAESATRYAIRLIDRIERRTHGRCSAGAQTPNSSGGGGGR